MLFGAHIGNNSPQRLFLSTLSHSKFIFDQESPFQAPAPQGGTSSTTSRGNGNKMEELRTICRARFLPLPPRGQP
jgi:hypothetical protein